MGFAGEFAHSTRARVDVTGIDGRRGRVAHRPWDRHRTQSRERRAHGVGRVADGRIEHRVALGRAQVQVPRERRHELFGADARRDVADREFEPEAAVHPRRGGSRKSVVPAEGG